MFNFVEKLMQYNCLFKGNQKIKFNLKNIDDVNEKKEK
jgi:hypothetical protein